MSEPPKPDDYLDIAELVTLTGYSAATIWRLKKAEKILYFQPGGSGTNVTFPPDALARVGASTEPGQPQVTGLESLHLHHTQVTDAGLVHLKSLSNLQEFRLFKTQVTNAGMVHLVGLTKLQSLWIGFNPKITDVALMHLKGLTRLQELSLPDTKVTDAGLVNLKGLNNLEWLRLQGTQVTDAGIADLQKALPNCKITK